MEGGSDVTRIIIDELHFSDIQLDQMEVKLVLLGVSLMNFILCISKEIKLKVKLVLLKVSLINFIVRISKEMKCNVKVV